MLVQFPSGSSGSNDQSHENKDIIGFITFGSDGTWSFLPADINLDPEDPAVSKMTEAIDFFAFALVQDDVIQRFHENKKADLNIAIHEWRRENIKLVTANDLEKNTETSKE